MEIITCAHVDHERLAGKHPIRHRSTISCHRRSDTVQQYMLDTASIQLASCTTKMLQKKTRRDTTGTPTGQNGDTTETPPGHHRDITGTPPEHHRDTTGTPPGHHRDTTETTPGVLGLLPPGTVRQVQMALAPKALSMATCHHETCSSIHPV